MLAFKLALRNLLGAGLRTWLNVIVLSFSFVIIIWTKGILEGWDRQARADMIKWEIAAGQYWHRDYDPYDPLTLTDSHGTIPDNLITNNNSASIVPVLITQGTLYPMGRMLSVIIRGIEPHQNLLALPTIKLKDTEGDVPAIIGKRNGRKHKTQGRRLCDPAMEGQNGTFDATEIRIAGIFDTNVPTVDVGQIWLPIEKLREMMLLPGEATILVTGTDFTMPLLWINGYT